MNKLIRALIKLVLPALLVMMIAAVTSAQSLPNVQKESVRSPRNIKVDGKTTEWNNKFQAYNRATDIYYTLSNDDEKIYLVVQAKYHDVVDKILRGGITLTINRTLNKHDNNPVTVTYPVLEGDDISAVTNMLARRSLPHRDDEKADVSVDDLNKLLNEKLKTIRISGLKVITDEDISVYNEQGVKAASQFDNQNAYTYELVVPLKFLSLPDNGADGFTYNIKIHEPKEAPVLRVAGSRPPPPPPPMALSSSAPTDFWGEYTLAKK